MLVNLPIDLCPCVCVDVIDEIAILIFQVVDFIDSILGISLLFLFLLLVVVVVVLVFSVVFFKRNESISQIVCEWLMVNLNCQSLDALQMSSK